MRGGQRQVELLISGLTEAGHECQLLAPSGSPLREAAAKAGYAVGNAEAKELWHESKHAALVHAHDARAHTLAAIASRRTFVVSRRVAFPVRRSVASQWKYHRARRFLAVSHFVAGQLQAAGVRKHKIDVVYDGVAEHAPAEPWSPEHTAVALASDDPQKGRDLVQAAAEIAALRILFSDDLARDLQRAAMFVYITRSEGLGSAALLAMSMGVPVIASAVGGLIEIFSHHDCGLLVPNDPQAVASAMRRILSEPGLAAGFIERGKTRIAQSFTKQHLITRTLDSYARALAG